MNLLDASKQWRDRPDDERFASLTDLAAHCREQHDLSRATVLPSRKLLAAPHAAAPDDGGCLQGLRVGGAVPSHWSFGQVAALAGAPAGYLRTLPAEMAADCLNWGLARRDVEDVGILLRHEGSASGTILAAATGPRYGRVWNSDIADALVRRFGDGLGGEFRVPGEFGKAVVVDRRNTTLYASDRDMWVFLADEEHRVDVPARGPERARSLARGFFVWNSEVGAATFGLKTFLFDYACANRIVWGAEGVQELRLRHTASAPVRFLDEVRPALERFVAGSARGVTEAVEAARSKRLAPGGGPDDVEEWLAKRFGRAVGAAVQAAHLADEGRPVETLWDAAVGATAYARSIPHQDARVAVETQAGDLLQLAR